MSCPRAYWYNYYGSWGGWEATASQEMRDAYIQKKLTSAPAWTGTMVHSIAERLLNRVRKGLNIDEEETANLAIDAASQEISDSERGRGLQRPSKITHFQEHYYGQAVDWDPLVDEIERQVRGIFRNRVFQRLLTVPERIMEVEQLRRFPVGRDEVWAALDVLVSDGSGGVVIIDWKTGEAHDDNDIAAQLGVYGLYASGVLHIPEDRILAMHVNLRYATETRHPVGPVQIDLARQTIAQSMAHMRSLLVDVENNIANKEDFELIPEGSSRCQWCNFRRACGRSAPQDGTAPSQQ